LDDDEDESAETSFVDLDDVDADVAIVVETEEYSDVLAGDDVLVDDDAA
jgi:hypothetical protein